MKIWRSQKGLTLVEVLAVIVILSIVMILSMQVFTNGMSFSDKEASKATMQQQSNYIFTVWREMHETGNPYNVEVSADGKTIVFTQYQDASSMTVVSKEVIQDDRFAFELNLLINGVASTITTELINPKMQNTINIQIKMNNLGKGTPSFKSETILSRL